MSKGPLIRITPVKSLFQQIFIAYNREMEWPEDGRFLLKSIMTNVKNRKWHYTLYAVNRISLTWPTREEFLEYVTYLEIEATFGELIKNDKLDEAFSLFSECREV